MVFSGSENARRIYIKRGIYGHFLLFTNRKIQGFPNVFGSVNLRYSFHYPVVFPVLQTPENVRFLAFTGRLTLGKRLVNQHSLKFSHWKTWFSPQFTSEILHFPLFAGMVNASKCRKTLVFQPSPSG